MPPAEIKAAIRSAALALGFDAVGFAPPHLAAEARAHLGEFLARGYHGDMGWLSDRAEQRGDWRRSNGKIAAGSPSMRAAATTTTSSSRV
jgi:epoxyqueuosine reductase